MDWYERPWSVLEGERSTPEGTTSVVASYSRGEWPNDRRRHWRKVCLVKVNSKPDSDYNSESLFEIEDELADGLQRDENGILIAKITEIGHTTSTEFMIYCRPNFDLESILKNIESSFPNVSLSRTYDIDVSWTIFDRRFSAGKRD